MDRHDRQTDRRKHTALCTQTVTFIIFFCGGFNSLFVNFCSVASLQSHDVVAIMFPVCQQDF